MIPIIICALGTIPKGMVKGLEDLEIRGQVENPSDKSIVKIGETNEKLYVCRSKYIWKVMWA